MKNTILLVAIIALLIGGVSGYIIAEKDSKSEETVPMGMHRMPDGSLMSNNPGGSGMSGMDHSAMMVSSEREFVAGMIPHHQEAVDTANEVLARGGTNEQIIILAKEIIAAQETEIALLKEWHQEWYGEEYTSDGSYKPMMRNLSNLSGAELDRIFLEDMIPHHRGAIMMAQSVRPYIQHQEITDMADAIMETQSAEIDLMQDLLTKL
ncbi:DUF305 domain-containing protein [bacterium]|nr:DUF305 domain-containing protein [bacterium]